MYRFILFDCKQLKVQLSVHNPVPFSPILVQLSSASFCSAFCLTLVLNSLSNKEVSVWFASILVSGTWPSIPQWRCFSFKSSIRRLSCIMPRRQCCACARDRHRGEEWNLSCNCKRLPFLAVRGGLRQYKQGRSVIHDIKL